MNPQETVENTVRYVDGLFGEGQGQKHARFLERIENPALREMVHRYHELEGDTAHLTVEENYLIGLCVLCAQRNFGTAGMFAKTLRHLGTPRERILAALARLAMWVGGLPATEASLQIQKALDEYDACGQASLEAWFPAAR